MDKALRTEADGCQLAVELLRQFQRNMKNCFFLARERPKGRRQYDGLQRALQQLRSAGSKEAEAGFCGVLTDLLASAVEGGNQPDFYERLSLEKQGRMVVSDIADAEGYVSLQ